MLVQIQHKGISVTGLLIGIRDVRRHFPDRESTVDLELDHLRIKCNLQPAFYDDQPQISDPRLSAWLEAKNLYSRSGCGPEFLALLATGENSFRVQLGDNNARIKCH